VRISRRSGVLSGFLLVLLGAWGGLVAFIGPYFHYAYTPDVTWTYNTERLWLEILPGGAVFLAGLLLIISSHRIEAMVGAWLAVASGAWFALGTVLSPIWNGGVTAGGSPVGTTTTIRVVEQIGFFTGLGVVIVLVAAMAIGRVSAVPTLAVEETPTPETAPTEPVPTS
jgi:hypothetical protein